MPPLRLSDAGWQYFYHNAQKSPETPPQWLRHGCKAVRKRKHPFQVRVNTRIDINGYPAYDVIGNYPDRVSAEIALAEYNKAPYNPNDRKKLFSEVFASWYQWKYKMPLTAPEAKTSSQNCMIAAYRKCPLLHDMTMWDIRAQDMQTILDQTELSHAMLEHIRNLFRQMYKYAVQYDLVAKDYCKRQIIGVL